jgi:hypothetical protein
MIDRGHELPLTRQAALLADVRAALGDAASLYAIARGLTERGVEMPRRGAWTATAVRRALGRIQTDHQAH